MKNKIKNKKTFEYKMKINQKSQFSRNMNANENWELFGFECDSRAVSLGSWVVGDKIRCSRMDQWVSCAVVRLEDIKEQISLQKSW